ncbi:MAG TPA: prepilin peptidase [Solirubrobacteraceae bacterium]|nr:prepilin peptidase [Solirubrobacteraceae bacterium]
MFSYLILTVAAGLAVGSFLNVVIHRLPRGESVISPPSRCPACDHRLRMRDNLPLISWLALRGRCRDCAAPIAVRYPLVELGTAALFVGVLALRESTAGLALGFALVVVLIPAAMIDLEHRIIPNRLMLIGAVAAVAIGTVLDPAGEPERLAAGVGAAAFLLMAVLAHPRGMGMGDVKLAGVMGLFLGAEVAVAMLVALVAGVLIGVLIMARRGVRAGRKTAVPFGPMLGLGGLTGLYVGSAVAAWYLGSFV